MTTPPAQDDLTTLDDDQLISQRAALRARLELLHPKARRRAALARQYDALTDEFDRRARAAWQQAAPSPPPALSHQIRHTGDTDMDAGTPADTLLAESTGRLRDHRTETALLLALEVVALNPAAVGDRELLRRLAACQERVQERLRARDQRAGEEYRGQPG
jgi:hypothetical protein